MELEPVRYSSGAQELNGFLVDGSGGRTVPGVLVAHEGAGLDDHAKSQARRIAGLGTVALALDLYGEVDPPLERAKELVRALRADRGELRRRTRAALEVLAAHPRVDATRIAAVGYCFGGTAVLELARDGADLACVVGFHPGLDAGDPADARNVNAPVLVCVGARDPIVNAAQRAAFEAEMEAAGADWRLLLLGGAGHGFTNPGIDAFGFPGFAFDARADGLAWEAMRALFAETLGLSRG